MSFWWKKLRAQKSETLEVADIFNLIIHPYCVFLMYNLNLKSHYLSDNCSGVTSAVFPSETSYT